MTATGFQMAMSKTEVHKHVIWTYVADLPIIGKDKSSLITLKNIDEFTSNNDMELPLLGVYWPESFRSSYTTYASGHSFLNIYAVTQSVRAGRKVHIVQIELVITNLENLV